MAIHIEIARHIHLNLAEKIARTIKKFAEQENTGVAVRDTEYFEAKIMEGKAVLAFIDESLAGYGYVEVWSDKEFVGNAGIIVLPEYYNKGVEEQIQRKLFELSRTKYPKSKVFMMTTSLPVMQNASKLGFTPVTYSELTTDKDYWRGCRTCKKYDVLVANEQKECMCTALLYKPDNQ